MHMYDQDKIQAYFDAMEGGGSTTERGRALEGLMVYVIAECDGVRHHGNNRLNSQGSSEIDTCFWNARLSSGLDFLPQILISECKNTAAPVGSSELRVFSSKLDEMHLKHGLFVAAQGITGNTDNKRAAHDIVRTSFQRLQQQILVITRAEIQQFRSTLDLITILQNKTLELTLGAVTF